MSRLRTKCAIAKRDGLFCHYCKVKDPIKELTVDHVIPICKGGKDIMRNYVLACTQCNYWKSDSDYEDFIQKLPSLIAAIDSLKKRRPDKRIKDPKKLLEEVAGNGVVDMSSWRKSPFVSWKNA